MFANATPFSAITVPFFDERGVEMVMVLVKATFLKRGPKLVLADEQTPVRMSDVPTDPDAEKEGRESSIRYPSDIAGEKPGADIVVVGSAVSVKPVESLDVAVRVPGRTVSLRVHGERVYYKGTLGLKIGPSARFDRSPVTYERAYGGTLRDRSIIEWHNPVGRGVHASIAEADGALAPCIEDPMHPIRGGQKATPVGLGAIPMWWLPRRALSGTMDATWQATRMPLPPLDFDRRFHQIAPEALQMDRPLRQGDVIATHGLCEEGLFDITVPALPILAKVHRAHGPPSSAALALDTALLEPEASRVELTFRKLVPLGRGKTQIREIRVDVEA